MKIFVTGGTGAIGKFLLPQLLEMKHDVVALTRSAQKAVTLEDIGVSPVIADPLDKQALTAAVRRAEPDVIIHQLSALSGAGNFRKLDQEFALTNRFRTEVTDNLLAAARTIGTRRFIAQSYCGWPYAKKGGPVKTEEDPLDPKPPESFTKTLAGIRYLEDKIRSISYLVVKKRKLPIVGGGGAIWSFIHIIDAARATVAAISHGTPGIYNVIDDEPAKVSTWLPAFAKAIGGKPPYRIPHWLGELIIGKAGVSMMTQLRGCSNAKAKRELNWTPVYPSWRVGFVDALD